MRENIDAKLFRERLANVSMRLKDCRAIVLIRLLARSVVDLSRVISLFILRTRELTRSMALNLNEKSNITSLAY